MKTNKVNGFSGRPLGGSGWNHVNGFSRRAFLATGALASLRSADRRIGLNFGTYGMKTLALPSALRTIAEIGYDGVEISLMPGWPMSDPREVRRVLDGTGLALPSLMESLTTDDRERLKRAIDFAHAVSPRALPVIETVIGRKSAEWEQVKNSLADELGEWAKLAEDGGITVCFKPHADQAVDTPERAIWLLKRVASPRIRIVYDYSHFFVQGLTLEASLRALFPYTSYIAVKDSAGDRNRHQFLLPGDGTTDYVAYLRLLKELGYGGFVGVEITSQIHSKPGYEPVTTARLCYERLARAFRAAGVERISRK